MQTVKLQKNNQLTAPAQMCRNNDWKPGDELLVFDLGGAIAYVDPSHFSMIDHFKEMNVRFSERIGT
jgi:hypothetical protein